MTIANGILDASALSDLGSALRIDILTSTGDWVTGRAYTVNQLANNGGVCYVCVIAHTSGTFATDLAAGKWAVYQGLSTAAKGVGRGFYADRTDEVLRASPNLFNKNATTVGFINTANGTQNSTATYFTTNAMAVGPNRSYVSNKTTPAGTGYAWYDDGGTFISGGTLTAGTAVTSPSNAATMKASFLNTADDVNFGTQVSQKDTLLIASSASIPSYRTYGYTDGYDAANRGLQGGRAYQPTRLNLFDKLTATASTLLARAGTTATNSAYFMTDYIPVRQGVGLALNADFVPGNSAYGWNWYDRDLVRIGDSASSVTANTTNGSTTVTVTAITLGPLSLGAPISGTGIPARAYITAVPAGGAGSLGAYTISAAATADGTGVTLTSGGVVANVAVIPPVGAQYGRVSVPTGSFNSLVIADGPISSPGLVGPSNIYSAPGYLGVGEFTALYPWSRKNLALSGDSIMQDATGANLMQAGIERVTRAVGVIFGGISGRKLRATLDGATGTYARGPTTAYTSTDFATIDVFFNNAVTNDFGILNTGVWGTSTPLGALGDLWIPSSFTATTTNGSNSINVSAVAFGTLAVGMPVAGSGIPSGATITAFGTGSGGTGTYTLSVNANASGTATMRGGSFYGDMYDIYIRKVQTWNPATRICLATPLPRFDNGATGNPTNVDGVTLSQYADAVIAFGGAFSLPVLDLFRRSGINAVNQTTFLGDGLHPNATGNERVSGLIGRFLSDQ